MEQKNTPADVPRLVTVAPTPRRPYAPPRLSDFGPIGELTQGTFAGVGADNGIYS